MDHLPMYNIFTAVSITHLLVSNGGT